MAKRVADSSGTGKAPDPPKWVIRYKTGRDALTPAEVGTLIKNCRRLEEEALLTLAITAGMRREDIVSVERHRVREAQENGEQLLIIEFWEHKKRREYTVRVGGACVRPVIQYMAEAPRSRFLFPGRHRSDHHLSSRSAYNTFQTVLGRAGLRKRPFHALRATCMKLCKAAGWEIEQVMELTGDTRRTVEEHYLTPSEAEMSAVAAKKPPISRLAVAFKERPIL